MTLASHHPFRPMSISAARWLYTLMPLALLWTSQPPVAQPKPEVVSADSEEPKVQGVSPEEGQGDEGTKLSEQQKELHDRLSESERLTQELKLWISFSRWSELKRLRDRVVNTRRASPTYLDRQRRFQEALAQRAQWEVSIPTLMERPTLEEVRVRLKLIEEAKKSLESRYKQGLSEQLTSLSLYLSQLLEQEQASLDLIEELIEQQLINQLEGPPVEEPSALNMKEVDMKELNERHERLIKLERIVTAELGEVEAWHAQLNIISRALEAEEGEYEAEQARLDQRSQLMTELLSQLLVRREQEDEIKELSLETLMGLRASKVDEDHQARALLEERLTSVKKLKRAYGEKHLAQLSALKPPVLPPPPTGEGDDSFQTAARLQYSVEASERFVRFHKARAEATRQALEAQEGYLKELESLLASCVESLKATLGHDVIDERILALSEPTFWTQAELIQRAKERETIKELRSLNELRGSWQKERAQALVDGERWRATLKEDEEASERHLSELRGESGLRERLKKELVWLTFLKEIDSYDTPKLISAYQRDVGRLQGYEQEVERLEGTYEELSLKLKALIELRERLSDPLMRQYPASDKEFRRWAAPLFELRGGDQAQESAEEGAEVGEEVELDHASLPSEVAPLTEALRARIPPRVNYYQERHQLTAQINQRLEERAQLITQLSSLFNQRGELARHIWRSATLLKRRHQREPLFELKKETLTHTRQSWVNTLKAASVNSLREAHEREAQWLTFEPDYASLKAQLQDWSALLSQIYDLIEQREELRRELDREDNPNPPPLSKLEADQKSHALKLRIELDQKWYESLWDLITSEDTKTLDELLEGLYIQLTKLERKQVIIDKSIKQSVLLVSRITEQRPILERLRDALEEALKSLDQRLSAERMKVMTQLDPQGSLSALSAFNSESALKVSVSQEAPLEGEERARVILGLKRIWSLRHAYLTTLSRVKDGLGTHGILERSVGQVKDSMARLQSEHEQLTRPLHRLLGNRARVLVRGEPLHQVGEIDRIRDERFQKKLKAGARIILSFCLIPFIALLLMRFVSNFGERIFVYVLREQTDRAQTDRERQEREERSATLFQVFRAASNLVIWTLTGIYLLKAVHVDVTPIIASAGVLGLALAFGAQELVRDFFAGFFILLENQYNIGDIVRIHGILGKIERITLRLTIIRDEEGGVVHFIPNGQVGMVSNCTREWSQARLDIGASYQAAPKRVIDCLRDVGDQLCADPVYGGYLLVCDVLGLERFDDSAVIYRVRLRVTAGQQWNIARIYRQRVMETFEERGIEIPFPQMVLHYSPPDLEPES